MRKNLVVLLLLTFPTLAFSQHRSRNHVSPSAISVAMNQLDSLSKARTSVDSASMYDIPVNPYLYRLFSNSIYYKSPIKNRLGISRRSFLTDKNKEKQMELNAVDNVLLNLYLQKPLLVENVELQAPRVNTQNKQRTDVSKVAVSDIIPEKSESASEELKLDMVVQKPNFWKKGGSFSLHFTENYISDNWHKGGESTNTMLSTFLYEANYDNQQGFVFSNKLEMRLGFVSSKSDSIHKYKTNNDLIRLTSQAGLKAVNNWYYTLAGEFNSQFMPGYKTNNKTMFSNFLAPANLIFSIGMEYKKSTKTSSLACNLSPLAYNFRYVGNKRVDETTHGLKKGRKTQDFFGSKIQVNSKFPVVKNVTWTSLFSYFTDYRRIESYWENTFNFQINTFLSTQLFVHARFDDSQIGEIQLKQYLSFGLSYNL